jgi:pimeloyl-ACP methyl ester carboxylesterase
MRFVLIHGGFHGAWCWERTIPELERLGHEAIAIDMPGHASRVDDISTHDNRREAIVSVLQPGDVLVGHSGGGYDITMATDSAPDRVGHVTYLAAGLPLEGRAIIEATGGTTERGEDGTVKVKVPMTDEMGMSRAVRRNADGRMECFDFEATRNLFYHDCDDATARWAFDRLTPSPKGDYSFEPVSVPRFWDADPPRSYILCLQDRAKPRWMSDQVARRLGVEPLPIDTSHSPFLSRPEELAELLAHAATTKPIGPLLRD